ncbi:MAG: DUF499 domain-containing protein [Armatimonadetes bacterium]|nr:DUF499 domain-containing protein [Armatimonadota bacterium]
MAKLPAWTDVVKPDTVVFSGRLNESLFAADLYDVVKGNAAREYQDPERFGDRTYPTEGMVQLLSDVLKRLMGRGEVNPIIQIQTPFGGGKTHSLIALYHMAKGGEKLRSSLLGEKVAEKSGFNRFPLVKVAIFVGTVHDPLQSKTPWGIIAEQLGQYDKVRENDQKRISPGREILEQVIGSEPTLILIDEIAEFVTRCPDDYQAQVLTFFHGLTEAVKSLEKSCLVVTLPSSVPYGEKGEKALRSLEQIFGRMQAIYEPVSGMEIYEVVRRRLFDFPEGWEQDAYAVVEEYIFNYRQWNDAPDWVKSEDYREKMLRAYPFHPLLIDWLYERWGSFHTFQRTRGVLRFLGHVVQDVWQQQQIDMQKRNLLIQPCQVNLGKSEIEEELIRHIGQEFRAVVQADIRERAPRIESGMGDWKVYQVATGLANSIFLASFTAAEGDRKGASLSELKIAVWRPGLEPAVITDALNLMNRSLLYLHEKEGLLLFSLEPNLTRLRLDYEERITHDEIQQELEKRLKKLVERKGDWEVRVAEKPEDVPNVRDIQMVLLPPHKRREESERLAKEILERSGTNPRVYRNALVVVFADEQKIQDAERNIKAFLALSKIERSEDKKRLSPNDLKRLSKEREEADEDALRRICEAYRFVVKLTPKGAELLDMGLMGQGESMQIVERVTEFLSKQDLLMKERVNPQQVLELMGDEREKPLKEIWLQYGQLPRLPILLNKGVLSETIRQGARQKLFAVRIDDREYYGDLIPPSGHAWVDDAVLLKEPTKESEDVRITITPQPALTVDEILELVATEKESINSVYQKLWSQKRDAFRSEAEFGEAFRKAIAEGVEQQLWKVHVGKSPVVSEDLDLQTILKGTLVVSRKPKEKMLTVQMKIPTERLGYLAMTLANLRQLNLVGDQIEISFKTPTLDAGKQRQLENILNESASQVGGEVQIK